MKNLMKFGTLGLLMTSLSACVISTSTDPYYGTWYDAFGRACGYSVGPGCDYYYNGFKISMMQDPFYYGQSTYGAWFSPDGIYYFNGFAMNTDQNSGAESRDVLTQGSEQAIAWNLKVAQQFSERYALNESASLNIVQTLNDWAVLGKDRARTEADVTHFMTRLYGISPTKALALLAKAGSEHDLSSLEIINVDVAQAWGTSPEISQKILKTWYARELSAAGF